MFFYWWLPGNIITPHLWGVFSCHIDSWFFQGPSQHEMQKISKYPTCTYFGAVRMISSLVQNRKKKIAITVHIIIFHPGSADEVLVYLIHVLINISLLLISKQIVILFIVALLLFNLFPPEKWHVMYYIYILRMNRMN